MHTEIRFPTDPKPRPTDANIRKAERILARLRSIQEKRERLEAQERSIIQQAAKLLKVFFVELP